MSEDLLDEYVKITKTIDNIHNKINKYKTDILDSIKYSSSEQEQKDKIKQFHSIIQKIKSDHKITNKYRTLKKSQAELKKKIINSTDFDDTSSSDISKQISLLKTKYDLSSKKKIILIDDINIYNNNIGDVKFNSILEEVQLNLIKNDIYKS